MEFSLALMNTSKMQEMFCGAQTLRKYMILPDTPEMTAVLDAICKATDAEFLQEMEALFNIELLVKTVIIFCLLQYFDPNFEEVYDTGF